MRPARGPARQSSSLTVTCSMSTASGSASVAGGDVAPSEGFTAIDSLRAPRPRTSTRCENSARTLHSTTTSSAAALESTPRHSRRRNRIVEASDPDGAFDRQGPAGLRDQARDDERQAGLGEQERDEAGDRQHDQRARSERKVQRAPARPGR